MTIQVTCPNCNGQLAADEKLAGKRSKCSKCGHVMLVPASQRSALTPITQRESNQPQGGLGLLVAAMIGVLIGFGLGMGTMILTQSPSNTIATAGETATPPVADETNTTPAAQTEMPIPSSRAAARKRLVKVEQLFFDDPNWMRLKTSDDGSRIYGHPSGIRVTFSEEDGIGTMACLYDFNDEHQKELVTLYWLMVGTLGGDDENDSINTDRILEWSETPRELLVLRGAVVHSAILDGNKAQLKVYVTE